mgnify:CR=1 FL=1
MKRLKTLTLLLLLSFAAALGLGAGLNSSSTFQVQKGFGFGPPPVQQKMADAGEYKVTRHGFPATYKEVQSFKSSGQQAYETSYDSRPFSLILLVTNIVFWVCLLVSVLAPITIFWRPVKKTLPELKPEPKPEQT